MVFSFLRCSDNLEFVVFFCLDFGGIKLRQWWQNLAKFEPGLCHHRPFSPKAPTVAKNGATVTMSSGKSFDHQLALALAL